MELSRQEGELRALKLALWLYALVFILKLAVYFLTGVMALLAEALHTLSDILISGFFWVAIKWSQKEADQEHTFGHGRAQNVAALVAATLFISFTSLRLYEEAIPRLFGPAKASYQNLPLALIVIIISMLIVAAPLVRLFRQKQRGAAAKAQLMELINDEMGLLAALVGILFIAAGWSLADPIAAITVATIIAIKAFSLFREHVSFLLGRSPGPELLERIQSLALSIPGVLGVHGLRAEYIGPERIHAGMHIEVQQGIPIEEADRIAREVQDRIHQEIRGGYCLIHVDPSG